MDGESKKKLQIQKYPDACGRGLMRVHCNFVYKIMPTILMQKHHASVITD